MTDAEARYALTGPTDERVLLDTFLDTFRQSLIGKVDGVSDEDAARPEVPSGTSLLWLIQHMVLVEQNWFTRVLQGTDLERQWPTPDEPLAEAVARYRAAFERSALSPPSSTWTRWRPTPIGPTRCAGSCST